MSEFFKKRQKASRGLEDLIGGNLDYYLGPTGIPDKLRGIKVGDLEKSIVGDLDNFTEEGLAELSDEDFRLLLETRDYSELPDLTIRIFVIGICMRRLLSAGCRMLVLQNVWIRFLVEVLVRRRVNRFRT